MVTLKSQREFESMKDSGAILAGIHALLRDFIKSTVKTNDINQFVHKKIEVAGAVAAQIGFEGYEFATCISVNDEICHGFPSDYHLKNGDVVKVDFCVNLNGAISDSCWTYAIGDISPEHSNLMKATYETMMLGIEQAVVGNRIGDISHTIQTHAESHGYGVVRDFLAHAIEPMITTGTWQMQMDPNEWTARTLDGTKSLIYIKIKVFIYSKLDRLTPFIMSLYRSHENLLHSILK